MDAGDNSQASPKSGRGRVYICLASAFSGEVPRDVAQAIQNALRSQPHLNDPRNFIQTMTIVWSLLSEMSFEDALGVSSSTGRNASVPTKGASDDSAPKGGTADRGTSSHPLCTEPRGAASFAYSKSQVLYDLAIRLPQNGRVSTKKKSVRNILREESLKVHPDFHQHASEGE